jgi:hypothetical protein
MPGSYHLAQLNIGRIRAPVEDPIMDGFMSRLDEINAVAEGTPGFVWRLQTDEGNATSIHAFDDPMLLVNMSVWESVAALHAFTYRSDHRELLRVRADWFDRFEGPFQVLWWVPAGHIPSVEEAKERLELLTAEGPTEEAFTFANRFPAPGTPG